MFKILLKQNLLTCCYKIFVTKSNNQSETLMKQSFTIFTSFLLILAFSQTKAQEYTFEDFIGTWHGYISSESFQGYNDPITMIISPNGFYTETSGHLMPTIYPNTQDSDFDDETNRYHWHYLQTVYAGQYFYQHHFYEIVYFQNDTLEMHYNYWDDPLPQPSVGTIFLVREITVGTTNILPEKKARDLVRVIDLLGRERSPLTKNEILIFQYSDGTFEKKVIQ